MARVGFEVIGIDVQLPPLPFFKELLFTRAQLTRMNGGQRAIVFLEFLGLGICRWMSALVSLTFSVGPVIDTVGCLRGNRCHGLTFGWAITVMHPARGVLPSIGFAPGQCDRQR